MNGARLPLLGMVLLVLFVLWAMAGCATTELPPADCQVRAGSAAAEGGYDPIFGAQGTGGVVSLVGAPEQCQGLQVFTRSANGSIVCYDGRESDFCSEAAKNAPVTVTPTQLRELMAP